MSGQTPSEGRRAEGGLRHVQPTLPASHSPSPPFLRHNGCLGVVTAYAIGSNFKQVGETEEGSVGGGNGGNGGAPSPLRPHWLRTDAPLPLLPCAHTCFCLMSSPPPPPTLAHTCSGSIWLECTARSGAGQRPDSRLAGLEGPSSKRGAFFPAAFPNLCPRTSLLAPQAQRHGHCSQCAVRSAVLPQRPCLLQQ